MTKIRLLPDHIINRIAAGEVVERPAGAIKELIENSIDANARRIVITLYEGGLEKFIVSDDGYGIDSQDFELVLTRHATSKISDDELGEADLVNLDYFGFRGEALSCISAISHLTLTSKHQECEHAYQVTSLCGKIGETKIASLGGGTRIEVSHIFENVPARLKFMKSPRSEQIAILDIVKRLSLAHPSVGFKVLEKEKILLNLNPISLEEKERVGDILGKDFLQNSLYIENARDDIKLWGYISIPTFHRGNGLQQFLYVNGRALKDKSLSGILRAAYQEYLAKDRHPICTLFLEVHPEFVDVNVHPTKAEVRFQKPENVRGLIISTIRQALSQMNHEASTHNTQRAIEKMNVSPVIEPQIYNRPLEYNERNSQTIPTHQGEILPKDKITSSPSAVPAINRLAPMPRRQGSFNLHTQSSKMQSPISIMEKAPPTLEAEPPTDKHIPPMGFAKGQVHNTYIVAQTEDDMIIVDQHAAHERIILEKVKDNIRQGSVQSQALLIPEIITFTEEEIDKFEEYFTELEKFGLGLERFGGTQILVRSVPLFLINSDMKALMRDVLDDVMDMRGLQTLEEKMTLLCATFACHHSIRAGRKLSIEEMNHLLREMEITPASGQCNHGRPTYIKLAKNDIERLFGRK